MTNHDLARSYLIQAIEILREAEDAYHRGVWNLVVRRSQEVVELALKGALRVVGLEVPHVHDVGLLLKQHREKFPSDFKNEIDELASISRRLRHEREVSFYGDEETGASPQLLYVEDDARHALEDARFVLRAVKKIVGLE